MSRRRGYYGYRSSSWGRSRSWGSSGYDRAIEHIREAEALRQKYGAAFDQIQSLFWNLDAVSLSHLLASYGGMYGTAAQEYAVRTFDRWRSGDVCMSGQTMTRLLDLLPRHLPDDQKLELIRQLREQTMKRLHRASYQLTVADHRSITSVVEQIQGMIGRVGAIQWPTDFREVAGWISQRDAQAMSALLAETEQHVAAQRLAGLIVHLVSLAGLRVLAADGHRLTVSTRFEIPTAQVEIQFRPSFWQQEENTMSDLDDAGFLKRLQHDVVEHEHLKGEISFIDYVMRTLTPEEQARLRSLAASEGLKVEVLLRELQVKTIAAKGDIDSTIELVQRLKAQRQKGTVTSTHQTASGETKIQIEAKGGPCYIATACYGDGNHPDVRALRRWRDQTLLRSAVGRALAVTYDRVSPPLARRLGRVGWLARLVRHVVLEPLVSRLEAKKAE